MKRIAVILLSIWIVIFLLCCAMNHFVLRYPIGDATYADYRLIPPTLHRVKQAADTATTSEIMDLLGCPNSSNTQLSVSNASYELQLGYVVTFTFWGDDITISQISSPFTSNRWLIFPAIMLTIAIIEFAVFYTIKKHRNSNRFQ